MCSKFPQIFQNKCFTERSDARNPAFLGSLLVCKYRSQKKIPTFSKSACRIYTEKFQGSKGLCSDMHIKRMQMRAVFPNFCRSSPTLPHCTSPSLNSPPHTLLPSSTTLPYYTSPSLNSSPHTLVLCFWLTPKSV